MADLDDVLYLGMIANSRKMSRGDNKKADKEGAAAIEERVRAEVNRFVDLIKKEHPTALQYDDFPSYLRTKLAQATTAFVLEKAGTTSASK